MSLVDTHCHVHENDYPLNREETLAAARVAGIEKVICVGTDLQSSRTAVKFAGEHDNVRAIIGVHPHEAEQTLIRCDLAKELDAILTKSHERSHPMENVVGIGEIGLDYFYNHSPREQQIEALNQQIELALKHDLPISFHVREAFGDFWSIFDSFHGIKGVLHSYTDNVANMERALKRGLYIGVNGIATFNKEPNLLTVHGELPLDRMLLETDAPFLAPVPFRGQPNQPSFIPKIVEFLAELRGESYDQIAAATTANAEKLFRI